MSSQLLQQRAHVLTPDQENYEPQRFTSMVVPIDRAARPDVELGEDELSLPSVAASFVAAAADAGPRPRWLRIAVSALTALLLLPILCLALFPVSILAVVALPVAGLVYAGSLGLRPQSSPRSGSGSSKSKSVPISRAA
jgi:hypothetical protein